MLERRRCDVLRLLLCCSLGEESHDRNLSSPYHRRSYHIIQNDPNQDVGADQR